MLPEDLPVRIFINLSIYTFFFFPQIFLEAGGGASPCPPHLQSLGRWLELGGAPCPGAGALGAAGGAAVAPPPLPGSAGQRPKGPHPALSILGTPGTRAVCECLWVCVRVPGGVRAWGGAWREPAPAGDGLNVALPALTSAIKGNNPASLAHFLNLAGLFAGGKENGASPRNTSVGVFFLFFGYCSWWLHALALLC